MKVNITYPTREKKTVQRRGVIYAARWPFIFAAYICLIVNICVGGRAWCAVAIWSMWLLWSVAFAPALVEYNRISQSIKAIFDACVLLILIDVLLSPGWALTVVPIVCFSGLILAGVLFFTDLERQKQNMLPMLLLSAVSLISSIAALIIWHGEGRWMLAVMGAIALALLAACFIALGSGLKQELEKRFHTK